MGGLYHSSRSDVMLAGRQRKKRLLTFGALIIEKQALYPHRLLTIAALEYGVIHLAIYLEYR